MSASLPLPPDPFAPARRAGTSYALVLQFAPAEQRNALAFLFTLKLTLDRLLEPGREPDVMRAKALWWEEELERTLRGDPRHPLTRRAHGLGLVSREDDLNLPSFAAGYGTLLGASPASAEDLLARARATGGELLVRVAYTLGERRPEGLEAARIAGTAHESVALLLHDRELAGRFPEGGGAREEFFATVRSDLEALPARAGPAWTGSGQRASRILVALTRTRLARGESTLLHKTFLAWWHARHEHNV